MIYTNEQISRIKELAGYLTPISDIAVLMDLDVDELRLDIQNRTSDVSKAYFKGKAESQLTLRQQELELARVGSPLAVQMAAGYMLNMDTDEDL